MGLVWEVQTSRKPLRMTPIILYTALWEDLYKYGGPSGLLLFGGWGRTQQSSWWMISVFITSGCMPFVNPVHTWAPDSVISSLFSIADIQYSNVRQGQVWQALSSPLHGNYARPGGRICLILLEDESATHLWLVALSGVSHGTGERLRVMDVCRGLSDCY